MKFIKTFAYQILILSICITACTKKQVKPSKDPRYTRYEAFKYMTTDPDRMIRILDSAVLVGNLSKSNAELDKSKCYYINNRIDTALIIIDRLLTNNQNNTNDTLLADILVFKSQLAQTNEDIVLYLKTSESASKVCKKIGGDYANYAADIDCGIGNIMVDRGDTINGLKKINDAIASIGENNDYLTIHCLVNCYSKLLSSLINIKRYNNVPDICDKTISLLDNIAVSEDFNASEETIESFRNFIVGKINCKKAIAYIHLGKNEEASKAFEICNKTDWAKRPYSNFQLVEIYSELGMYDEYEKSIKIIEQLLDVNNKSQFYVDFLNIQAKTEWKRGNTDKSLRLYRDALDVQQAVNKHDYNDQIARIFALNEVNEARQDAYNASIKIYKLYILLIVISIALIVIIYFFVKGIINNKRIKEVTKNIIEQNAKDADDEIGEQADDYDSKSPQIGLLYTKIIYVMNNEKPYTNPDFDIAQLASCLKTNKSYISRAINNVEGKNFRTWLANYRNNIIVSSIVENNNITTNELCELAGYVNRETLSRHFKAINGITISEFRQQLSNIL